MMNVLYTQLVILILNLKPILSLEYKATKYVRKYDDNCVKISKQPYFEAEILLGKPWRIYYTWNMKIDNKCLDMTFRNATPKVIQRFWNDMYDYVEQQPVWDAAVLYATLGGAHHEILLIADQGAEGSFTVVPNVAREATMSPLRSSVPLLKFYMKLLNQGKFLVMVDCHMGIVSLLARAKDPPYRSEILGAAAQLDLGVGYQACTGDKNRDEQFMDK